MLRIPLIAIVEDDDAVRQSLASLMRSLGYAVATYASAEAFLDTAGMGMPDAYHRPAALRHFGHRPAAGDFRTWPQRSNDRHDSVSFRGDERAGHETRRARLYLEAGERRHNR